MSQICFIGVKFGGIIEGLMDYTQENACEYTSLPKGAHWCGQDPKL